MAELVGIFGVIVANLMLLNVRLFARRLGLNVRWWSRTFAPERAFLRTLARSSDAALAGRARFYLRCELAAWIVGIPSILCFFWGVAGE